MEVRYEENEVHMERAVVVIVIIIVVTALIALAKRGAL